MDWACNTQGGEEELITILFRKRERRTPLGTPKCKWEDIIKMNVIEIEWGCMDWINVAVSCEHGK